MQGVRLIAMIVVLFGGAIQAHAQALSLEFTGGRVRLVANNVPISRILSEWARLGNTTILHGERVPGTPVTLQLVDVYEQEALRVLLRSTGGYVVAAREEPLPGASAFDRILILPAGGSGSRPALNPATTALFPDDFDFGDPVGAAPAPPLPRGVVPPVEADVPQPEPEPAPPESPQQRPRNNPFRTAPGSARPGVIAPAPDEPAQEP